MKLKKILLSSVVMLGIFSCTASFAATAEFSGYLPLNNGNMYTSTRTKSTNQKVGSVKATSLPSSGINVCIQIEKYCAAFRATDIASVKDELSHNLTYSGYYNPVRSVYGGSLEKFS